MTNRNEDHLSQYKLRQSCTPSRTCCPQYRCPGRSIAIPAQQRRRYRCWAAWRGGNAGRGLRSYAASAPPRPPTSYLQYNRAHEEEETVVSRRWDGNISAFRSNKGENFTLKKIGRHQTNYNRAESIEWFIKTKGLVLYKLLNTLCNRLSSTVLMIYRTKAWSSINHLILSVTDYQDFLLLWNNVCCWCQYRYLVFTIYERQKKYFLGFNPYLILGWYFNAIYNSEFTSTCCTYECSI